MMKIARFSHIHMENHSYPHQSVEHSPIIHFHVLSVEKENSGGDVTDVKVSCVDWSFIHINDVDGRHVAQVMGSF